MMTVQKKEREDGRIESDGVVYQCHCRIFSRSPQMRRDSPGFHHITYLAFFLIDSVHTFPDACCISIPRTHSYIAPSGLFFFSSQPHALSPITIYCPAQPTPL